MKKIIILAVLTMASAFSVAPATLADTCTETITISPGYWTGCPDSCQWVPPRTTTIQYEC